MMAAKEKRKNSEVTEGEKTEVGWSSQCSVNSVTHAHSHTEIHFDISF